MPFIHIIAKVVGTIDGRVTDLGDPVSFEIEKDNVSFGRMEGDISIRKIFDKLKHKRFTTEQQLQIANSFSFLSRSTGTFFCRDGEWYYMHKGANPALLHKYLFDTEIDPNTTIELKKRLRMDFFSADRKFLLQMEIYALLGQDSRSAESSGTRW